MSANTKLDARSKAVLEDKTNTPTPSATQTSTTKATEPAGTAPVKQQLQPNAEAGGQGQNPHFLPNSYPTSVNLKDLVSTFNRNIRTIKETKDSKEQLEAYKSISKSTSSLIKAAKDLEDENWHLEKELAAWRRTNVVYDTWDRDRHEAEIKALKSINEKNVAEAISEKMKTLNRDFGIFKVKIANELDAIRQSEEETDEMIIAQEEEISRLKQEIYKLSGAKAQKAQAAPKTGTPGPSTRDTKAAVKQHLNVVESLLTEVKRGKVQDLPKVLNKKRKAHENSGPDEKDPFLSPRKRARTDGDSQAAVPQNAPDMSKKKKKGTRFIRPNNGFRDHDKPTSISATVQAMASILDVEKISQGLGLDLSDDSKAHRNDEVGMKRDAAKEFLRFIRRMQNGEDGLDLNTATAALFQVREYRDRLGVGERDPAVILNVIYDCLGGLGANHLKEHEIIPKWRNCPDKTCPMHPENRSDKLELWYWSMRPEGIGETKGYKDHTEVCTLAKLFQGENERLSWNLCDTCYERYCSGERLGLLNNPKVLTLRFRRAKDEAKSEPVKPRHRNLPDHLKKRFNSKAPKRILYPSLVELPPTYDFKEQLSQSAKTTEYSLSAVIKCRSLEVFAEYVAYTKTTSGWWECRGTTVKKVEFEEVSKKYNGETYLAFYTRNP